MLANSAALAGKNEVTSGGVASGLTGGLVGFSTSKTIDEEMKKDHGCWSDALS